MAAILGQQSTKTEKKSPGKNKGKQRQTSLRL